MLPKSASSEVLSHVRADGLEVNFVLRKASRVEVILGAYKLSRLLTLSRHGILSSL
jgi:hypothetical protein